MEMEISELLEILHDSEECIASFCISPINKKSYNFILTKSAGHYELLQGAHTISEFLIFAKAYAPQGCSYEEFINEISHTKDFLSAYRSRFYQCEVNLPKRLEELILILQELDFNIPQTSHWGHDGFSLRVWMPGFEKEFQLRCCYYDEHYAPTADLANALLYIVAVDPEYRFKLCPN